MSRIRTIKPEFWTSEQVVSCSPHARLLFIGLWNFCDDNGVHPASYVRLKAEIFPVDSFTVAEVKNWINELISYDLLREYAIENKAYWIVTGWKSHQRIDKPTYRHPLPQPKVKNISDMSATIHREIDDYSPPYPLIVDDPSTTECKGVEGNGEDKEIGEVKASHCVISKNHPSPNKNVQEIFHYWQTIMNHPYAKLDTKRTRKIVQALKDGYTVEQLKQAIDGCNKTSFNMGENDRCQRYDDIGLILRDAEHIDRFITNAINPPANVKKNITPNDMMAGVII